MFVSRGVILVAGILLRIVCAKDNSTSCFEENAACGISNSLKGACSGADSFTTNATCYCESGWIGVEDLCHKCRKNRGANEDTLEIALSIYSDVSSECVSSKVHIATIPPEIKSQLSSYKATNTIDHPNTGTDDEIPSRTYDYTLPWTSLHTRTFHGGGDSTPTAWLTDTRDPNTVAATEAAESTAASSLRRENCVLGLIGLWVAVMMYCL